MTDPTATALERLLRDLDRGPRRPRSGFRLAPLYLILGMVVGEQLLVRFVPLVWANLPGGLAQADGFRGWPGLIRELALACHLRFPRVLALLSAIGVAGLLLSRGPLPLRFLVWLAAVGAVLIDAGIVYVTIRTYMAVAIVEG